MQPILAQSMSLPDQCDRREFIAAATSIASSLSGLNLSAISVPTATVQNLSAVCTALSQTPSWEFLHRGHFFSGGWLDLQRLMEPDLDLRTEGIAWRYEMLFDIIELRRSGELESVGMMLNQLTEPTYPIFEAFHQERSDLYDRYPSPRNEQDEKTYRCTRSDLVLKLQKDLNQLGITDKWVQYHLKWLCLRNQPGAHSVSTEMPDEKGNVRGLVERWTVPEGLSMSEFLSLEGQRAQDTCLRVIGFVRSVLGDQHVNEVRATIEEGKDPADVAEVRRMESREQHLRKQESTVDVEHPLIPRYRSWYGTDLLQIEDLEPRAKQRAWI